MEPLSDTHPRVAAKQIELLRKAGPVRCAEIALRLSWDVIPASRRAIAEQHREWSEEEVKLHWAELNYGEDLARRVRVYLVARR